MTTPPRDGDGPTEKLWSHGGETAGWRKTNSSVGFAPRSLTWLDGVIMISGVAVLMLSFFGYYTHTLVRSFGSTSRVSNAWDNVGTDVWGCVAAVVVGAGVLVLLLAILFFDAGAKSSLRFGVLVCHLVAAAALVAAYFVVPHYSFAELDGYFADSTDGHGYAYWVSVALVVVATAGCLQRLREVNALVGQGDSAPSEQPGAVDAQSDVQSDVVQSGPVENAAELRQTRAQRRAAESRRGRHSG